MTPASQGRLGVALCLAAFFPTLRDCADKWLNDPQYSHGLLVPLFCLYLLWIRKDRLKEARPRVGLGMALLALVAAGRFAAGMTYFVPLDGLCLILSLAGVCLIAGGFPWMKWAGPALMFGLFAVPLPYAAERALGAELQRVATTASTALLQICGQPAVAEGNRILIRDIELGVVEACSGLRMLTTFVAFSVAAVFLIDRSWFTKLVILLAAVPIALMTNVLRIVGTGLAHVWLHDSDAKGRVLEIIHDFNGWMMMPIGLAMLWLTLAALRRLVIETPRLDSSVEAFAMN